MSHRVYYLGGLVPSIEKGGPPLLLLRANDKVVRIENKLGAYVDLNLEVQAEDMVATHRLLTKDGDFPAFTRNSMDVQMALRSMQGRRKQKPEPQVTREDVINSISREEALAILNRMNEPDEEDELMEEV